MSGLWETACIRKRLGPAVRDPDETQDRNHCTAAAAGLRVRTSAVRTTAQEGICMNRLPALCALACASALIGCNKSDVRPPSSAAPTAMVGTTPMAARPASSPASDPSLPEASSVFPPASGASGS